MSQRILRTGGGLGNSKASKTELLRNLFGDENNPDIPSHYDRWANIQNVVRAVYKDVSTEYGFYNKRWTEISPRFKSFLSHKVLSGLADYDQQALCRRPEILERLIKNHSVNKDDWRREKLKKAAKLRSRDQSDTPLLRRVQPLPAITDTESEKKDFQFKEFLPRNPSLQMLLRPLPSLVEKDSVASLDSKSDPGNAETGSPASATTSSTSQTFL
ncbi:hypothetical protein TWF694_010131 [Orbilia ellipsospora]|uniref:Uncharacterized protein n=1 Tax=Orbilia ellipsospora TaxID=2528407 RepID=A0AAV9XC26_9PEZI